MIVRPRALALVIVMLLFALAWITSAQLSQRHIAAQLAGLGAADVPARRLIPATAPATAPSSQLPPLFGPGLMVIDDDGDGYGVGCSNGPDADDGDPQVSTPESALKKHGTIDKVLIARGYKVKHIYYVAPDGDDATGKVDDPQKPYRTFGKVPVSAGEAVLFRAGAYKAGRVVVADTLRGRTDAPILIAAYPGEKVVFDSDEACIELDACSNVIVDGFVLDNSDKDREGRGLRLVRCSNVTARNCEVLHHYWGIMGMQDLHNILIERCVVHDIPHEHGIYLGCRELANSDLTVRRCVIYHCAQQGLQHNGRVKNFRVEQCIIHSNGQAGLLLMQGAQDSTIAGNLIFNNSKQAIVIYNYDSTDPSIVPFDQTGNTFEGNIVWVGSEDWQKQYSTEQYPAVLFNDSTGSKKSSFDGNIFRHNVICTTSGAAFQFNQARFADTTIVQDNLLYRQDGGALLLAGQKALGLTELNQFAKGYSGNSTAGPGFVRARTADFATPEKFDFRCDADSLARKVLQAATMPTTAPTGQPSE